MWTVIQRLAAAVAFSWSALASGGCCAADAAVDIAGVEFFESHIRPALAAHCYACHSADAERSHQLKADLRLDTPSGILASATVVPGDPAASSLIDALHHGELKMPPDGRLADEVIAKFEAWVERGAPLPPTGPKETTSQPTSWQEEGDRWAFQVPVQHSLPTVREGSWLRGTIDAFILSALEERGLRPVRPASRSEWLRRVTFDLIGLPPTRTECDAFERDNAPDAFERVVDRLLASPQYGERWSRYWLDLARYADDQGNSFLTPSPSAYLYRDWVVRSFNRDLPYDEFIRLQLAGDQLTEPAEDYVDRLAGLGFQGLGPQFRKLAAGEAKAKADELEERVDTLSRALLGLTVSCARCHDHKFDPIPTSDYYSLAAAYNGAEWIERPLCSPEAVATHERWQTEYAQKKEQHGKWTDELGIRLGQKELPRVVDYTRAAWKILVFQRHKMEHDEVAIASESRLDPFFFQRWYRHLERSAAESVLLKTFQGALHQTTPADANLLPDQVLAEAEDLKARVIAALTAWQLLQSASGDERGVSSQALEASHKELLEALCLLRRRPFFAEESELPRMLDDATRQKLKQRQEDLQSFANSAPPLGPIMPSVRGGGQGMQIFVRGDPEKLGALAPPGFLQVLGQSGVSTPAGTFTRLELADSIVSRQNPLAARVFVNRVWHHHFGRGIVATPSNFGKLGSPPSHPELLDTLAARFMDAGWSIKWLHREIMLSATYGLSSDQDAANMAMDSGNEYLWRMTPRRLDIEAWRDAVLHVAGQLDLSMGGPTLDAKNPGIKEMADFEFFTRLNGPEADQPTNRRRTLYSVISRYAPNPALTLFDFPEPNVTSDQRTSTTVPQQQLFVLNSDLMLEMSRRFGTRIEQSAATDEERLQNAWLAAYGRPAKETELQAALNFVHSVQSAADGSVLSSWHQLAHALFASNEFMFVP